MAPMTTFRPTVAELRDLPPHTTRITFDCACGDLRERVFTGPLLHDVMRAKAPGFDPARPYAVTVTAHDGHATELTRDELDGVLLATAVDGRDLGGAGPRLAVPHDTGGGRCVAGVAEIRIAHGG